MYPANLLSLFPPFPRDMKVFVAMAFDQRFEHRWRQVVDPGIRSVEVNGTALVPHRVDTRKVSDSIITEIISGIGNDIAVFADITSIGHLEDRPIRNGNVMYEVGLAHSVRLPEEVLLFRSDNDPLLFDVAGVRVRRYDPDGDPDAARRAVGEAIRDSVREVELVKHIAVEKAARSLDFASWNVLMCAQGILKPPKLQTMRDVMRNISVLPAITRLLEMGAIETEYLPLIGTGEGQLLDAPVEDLMRYRITQFGAAVLAYGAQQMGITRGLLEKLLPELTESNEASNDA